MLQKSPNENISKERKLRLFNQQRTEREIFRVLSYQQKNFVWQWDLAQIEWSKNLHSPQKHMLLKDEPPAKAPIWRLVSNAESHIGNDCSAKTASEQPTPKAMEDNVMDTVCMLEYLSYSIPI